MPINANYASATRTATSISSSARRAAQRVRMAMSNSFGFGGSNSCVVAAPSGRSRRCAGGDGDRHDEPRASSSPAPAPSAPPAWRRRRSSTRRARARRRSRRSSNGTRPAGRCTIAGEIADFNPRALVDDRKLHKLIRRTDLLGLYAAGTGDRRAPASSRIATRWRPDAAARYSDRTGVYVGSGGGNYENQYDYFPLMAEAGGDLPAFGRELANTVNPMWLLRTLPNNVLGHIGIKHGLKGTNACITNHSVGGTLAVIEAMEALRNGEADRVGRGRATTRRSSRRWCCTTTGWG